MFIILICSVLAIGNSRVANKVTDVPDCNNNLNLKVYPEFNNTYQFINCTYLNQSDNTWICPCMTELYLQIPNGTTNSFSFTAQYNTGVLSKGNDSKTLVYNEALQRIIQISNFVISEKTEEEYRIEQEVIQQQNDATANFIIKFILGFFIVCMLVVFIFILLSKLRKKYKLEDDEKLTIKMILGSIFSRSDIKRKEVESKNIIIKKVEQPKKEIEIKKDIITSEEKVRKLLEQINK